MSLLSRLLGKHAMPDEPEEARVPVAIPPLREKLSELEASKGAPLTEAEVTAVRDQAFYMNMWLSDKQALDARRGYRDIDRDNAWAEWQALRQTGQDTATA